MLTTELYDGQGFGNQLWSYVFTRVLALDKDVLFGIQSPEKFKGLGFLDLDMGQLVTGGSGPEGGPPTELPNGIKHYYSERDIRHPDNDFDVRIYDAGLVNVLDDTKIDGVFQSEDYINHRKSEIFQWLKYTKVELDIDFEKDNICVINFRGGEYKRNPKVFLRRRYWRDSIKYICTLNPLAEFIVITDDVNLAKRFFPKFRIRHYGIAGDYQAINLAKYVILSNSSFGFFPAWLNTNLALCIAPKYWWAHNVSDGFWACSFNITRNWLYMDREGKLFDYEQSKLELERYQGLNKVIFEQKRITNSFVVISSFNNDLSWLPRYSDNYIVFEQGAGSGIPSHLDRGKIRNVANNGSNFKDYFTYIIENYENLPDVVFLLKGNVFPRHVRQHVFDTYLDSRKTCSIIDQKRHHTNFPLDYFGKDGMYYELNSDWFLNLGMPCRYFQTVDCFLNHFCKSMKRKNYNRFSLGAQYIVSRDELRTIPKAVYQDLLQIVSYGSESSGYTNECFIVERSLDRLWQNFAWKFDSLDPTANLMPSYPAVRYRKRVTIRAVYAFMAIIGILIGRSGRLYRSGKSLITNRVRYVVNSYLS